MNDRPRLAALRIEGAAALLPDGSVPDAALLIQGGRITAVGPDAEVQRPPDAARFDAHGLVVAPGLIDLQVNGGFGHDFTEDPASIWAVGARLPELGATAFVPTLVSPSGDEIAAAQASLAGGPPDGYRGAMPLGWHVEGPFIDPARAGAHDPARLRMPGGTGAPATGSWRPSEGIRMVTLAPELPGALELVADLAARGVVVAAGHSSAGYEQAEAGIEAGIRYVTHLFNAMAPMTAREPGLAGAALDDPRVMVGLITDGLHVHPALVRLVHRMVGRGRFSAVTDATAALGMPDGAYRLAGRDVTLDGGAVRASDGRLAGSALAPYDALRDLARMTGREPWEAAVAMTAVPAVILDMAEERGSLKPGARADFVLLDDRLRPVATFVAGEQVHGR